MATGSAPDSDPAVPGPSPSVAALVLNYNGREITLQAIASLLAMRYENFDVIHIDNGSTDGSSEAVAAAFPQVRTVRAEQNQGPTAGLNLGLRAGLEAGYDYLLSLNNDIEVDPRMLSELVATAESAAPSMGSPWLTSSVLKVNCASFWMERRDSGMSSKN